MVVITVPVCTGSVSGVDAALGLGRARPAPAARVGARLDAGCAGTAADRRVAVVDERVHQHAVLTDVVVDVFLRPLDNRVDLHHLAPGVPLHDLGIGSGVGLLPADAGDPGV